LCLSKVLIRGNHDTFTLKGYELKDFYIENEISFIHGYPSYPEIFEKGIKTIVMSHIHPAVSIHDKKGVKKEKYKAFLVGKYKKKKL
jgi:metallophosphoesterase superfamily enzyme